MNKDEFIDGNDEKKAADKVQENVSEEASSHSTETTKEGSTDEAVKSINDDPLEQRIIQRNLHVQINGDISSEDNKRAVSQKDDATNSAEDTPKVVANNTTEQNISGEHTVEHKEDNSAISTEDTIVSGAVADIAADVVIDNLENFDAEETVICSGDETIISKVEGEETIISSIDEQALLETQKVDVISLDGKSDESTTVEVSMKEVFSQNAAEQTEEEAQEEAQEINGRKVLFPAVAVKKIKETGIIEDAVIPFLNLDGLRIVHPLVIRNCQLQGIVARGTVFEQGIEVRDSEVTERLEFSAWRGDEGLSHTIIREGITVADTLMNDNVSMRNTRVVGDVVFENCEFKGTFRLDQSKIEGDVLLDGEGDILLVSAFRCHCHEFKIRRHTIVGHKKESLDLNSSKIARISLSSCTLEQALKMKKSRVGNDDTNDAFYASGCTFADVDMSQSMFFSKVYWHEITIKGKFVAEMPKEEKGRKIGKPVYFKEDIHFDSINFEGKTDFYGARFGKYARFIKCVFHKQANFNQAEFQDVSSFWMSEFMGRADFKKTTLGGRSNFGKVTFNGRGSFNEATFGDESNFYLADVKQDIFFTGATFENHLVLRNINFGGGVGLSKIYARKNIKISQSNVADRLILSGSNIEGAIIAPALTVGTWGSLADSRVHGYIDFGGLKVGTKLSAEDKEKLSTFHTQEERGKDDVVPGTFYMTDSTFHKEINMFSANIAGDLCLDGINSYAEWELNSVDVGNDVVFSKSYFRGMIRCENSTIGGKLYSHKARFKEEASWNGLKCQSADLRFSSFDGGFTMRYGRIEKELKMYNTDVDGKVDLFRCKFGDISFNHMLVDHFLIDRHSIGDELSSEKNGEFSHAVTEYGILKQSFHQRNDYESMDWAYYRFCRSKRKMKKASWKRPMRSMGIFFDWLFLDKGFGYGTRPMNIAFVALSCVFVFAILFSFVPNGILGPDGPLTDISFSDSFYLSITTFASMDYGDSGPVLDHWLKHLFSLEGILGIFLTTLFVATISRKIIRS
ncbi:potassium channel family protein [Candidatus Uabimicrobium amorphum]|uniref:Potassium channel domain-containing protein n=1 Tax=Uabimicrobium amorphum TaxID=2596890 RepID=A0A5S9III2_UABAM|nr:potassium channel family protein [Candidatus Uabimicrobium amorphum]BBM82180.1 hypothetical protein UABAM_00523 [Candidatus Uabimicrobium amorphum]